MKYFAYGSNMSIARLQARVPSAIRIETASLKGHQLRFDMSGDDGSGKCNAFQTDNNNDIVIGALFNINSDEKGVLDKAESLGDGYAEKLVEVQTSSGVIYNAVTYYALKINPHLKPYSWYLHHVVTGAKETNLPSEYLNIIESVSCIEDQDILRDQQQRAIHL